MGKIDRLTRPGERYRPHEILILPYPKRIGFQPAHHVGEHRRRIGRRRPLPSPADVRRRCGQHELGKTGRRSDVPLERGEIVQVTHDRRIVFGSRAIARADTPPVGIEIASDPVTNRRVLRSENFATIPCSSGSSGMAILARVSSRPSPGVTRPRNSRRVASCWPARRQYGDPPARSKGERNPGYPRPARRRDRQAARGRVPAGNRKAATDFRVRRCSPTPASIAGWPHALVAAPGSRQASGAASAKSGSTLRVQPPRLPAHGRRPRSVPSASRLLQIR
jgi:hypothetical protein